MSRCLSMVNTAIVSIVCLSVAGGCALQGDEQGDPSDSGPTTQELAAPQLLIFDQPFTTDQFGQIFLTGILNIRDYNEVNLEINQFPSAVPNMTVQVLMGKLSGHTLGSVVGSFALNSAATIRTFAVRGPEISVIISGGPANTTVNIFAWLYLH